MRDCNQCGKCCTHYSDGGLSASESEIDWWETNRPEIFSYVSGGEIWIYTLNNSPIDIEHLEAAGAQVLILGDSGSGKINLTKLMSDLAKREINEVHTECGQTLAGALIQRHLADEIVIYMAPKLMGSQSIGAFDLGQLTRMSDSVECNIEQLRMIGEDIRLTLSLKTEESARSVR